jgi:hypothetical protein
MTLLVAGFGLTYRIDSRGVELTLVPAPTSSLLEKRYSPRGSAGDVVAQLRRLLPDAKVAVDQNELAVAARQEDHEKIERLLAGQPVRLPAAKKAVKSSKAASEKLYSLTVANEPAGKVVRKVAESLGLEMKYDSLALEKLKQPVTFSLKDASLDLLMETTLKPLGLSYQVNGKQLEVVPLSK